VEYNLPNVSFPVGRHPFRRTSQHITLTNRFRAPIVRSPLAGNHVTLTSGKQMLTGAEVADRNFRVVAFRAGLVLAPDATSVRHLPLCFSLSLSVVSL
jgi:hypothetical protein